MPPNFTINERKKYWSMEHGVADLANVAGIHLLKVVLHGGLRIPA